MIAIVNAFPIHRTSLVKYIAGPQARQAREMTTGGWRRGT